MSRFIDFAPDGGEGAGEGGAGDVPAVESGAAGAEGGAAGAFSPEQQAQVDRIVQERLARQKAQFKDYDDLKTKAAEFDKIAEASKTELQRATEAREAAERQATEATERAQRLLTDASITAAATGKLTDPTDALALVDRAAIEYGDDGSPANVAALVEALIEAKPHLAAKAQRKVVDLDQGARGGSPVLDDAALMGLGDDDFLKALGR